MSPNELLLELRKNVFEYQSNVFVTIGSIMFVVASQRVQYLVFCFWLCVASISQYNVLSATLFPYLTKTSLPVTKIYKVQFYCP